MTPTVLPDAPRLGDSPDRVRVLCVDDEPLVLGGLSRTLRPTCDVRIAVGGRAGIEALVAEPEIAVVISDLRMPDLDGATFLACVRRVAPHAARIVLTGQADVQSAIDAVNQGEVFRFLLKPIAPDLLRSTVQDAVVQRRAIATERALVEEIVPGSIAAFAQNLLARVHPTAFARAMRLKRLVVAIGPRLAIAHCWPVEVAALLSQVGLLALPQPLADRVCLGQPLTPDEARAVAAASLLSEQMVVGIPRLESVRYILRHAMDPESARDSGADVDADAAGVIGARLLRFALAYDELASCGMSRTATMSALAARFQLPGDDTLFAALQAHVESALSIADVVEPSTARDGVAGVVGEVGEVPEIRVLALSDVEIGMVFAAHVITDASLVLIACGQEVTAALAERIHTDWRNFAGSLSVRVICPVDRR